MSNTSLTFEDCRLISLDEACLYTDIGRNTMLKLSKKKGFPAMHPTAKGKKNIIDKVLLIEWLSKNYGNFYRNH